MPDKMGMTYSWITQPACVSANRITDDIAAVRMNETVEPLLAQQTGIALDLVIELATKRYSHVEAHTYGLWDVKYPE